VLGLRAHGRGINSDGRSARHCQDWAGNSRDGASDSNQACAAVRRRADTYALGRRAGAESPSLASWPGPAMVAGRAGRGRQRSRHSPGGGDDAGDTLETMGERARKWRGWCRRELLSAVFGLVLPCPATVGLGQSNHGFIRLPGRAVWSKNAVVISARSVGGRSRQKMLSAICLSRNKKIAPTCDQGGKGGRENESLEIEMQKLKNRSRQVRCNFGRATE
jgi:hypothetical protein